ncbi:hypothetical protein SDC9_202500 [bioreactor metagenome]|uniref:Uncharacterized protein n=1 Tax=bioreactor metagenome TaxID=1076179 RepID=A0A645J5S9_9ZZZZ
MKGAQPDGAFGRLSFRGARLGCFKAMIHCIADHVHQRAVDFLDDAAIQFGIGAADLKLNHLAGFGGEISHQAGHFLERAPDRHHSQRHGGPLQFVGNAPQLGQVAHELLVLSGDRIDILGDLRLRHYHFANEVHQAVQLASVDLDDATV